MDGEMVLLIINMYGFVQIVLKKDTDIDHQRRKMMMIEVIACVYCGKKDCVCGKDKHSPKPVIKPNK
jgi:hypothetical protein